MLTETLDELSEDRKARLDAELLKGDDTGERLEQGRETGRPHAAKRAHGHGERGVIWHASEYDGLLLQSEDSAERGSDRSMGCE
jgi:hypothetical protein